VKPWRWNELTEKEKQICRLVVMERKKRFAIQRDMGISKTNLARRLYIIYLKLDVSDKTELAFEMGKHWKEIN